MSELPEDVRVQILQARPGDIVVLSATRLMGAEQAKLLRDHVEAMGLVHGVKFIVADGLVVDKVIRPEEEQ